MLRSRLCIGGSAGFVCIRFGGMKLGLRSFQVSSVSRDASNFTHAGILPFLQYRINECLESKDVNASPTSTQFQMLEVLKSGKSLVLKDNLQSGKSFGMLVHVINEALERRQRGVGSVILVPNDTVLLKYKEWAGELIGELGDCVLETRTKSGSLELEIDQTNSDGSTDKVSQDGLTSHESPVPVPLNIQIIDSHLNTACLSTGKVAKPHIVIMNSGVFDKVLAGEQRKVKEVQQSQTDDDSIPGHAPAPILTMSDFTFLNFVGIDNATLLFNSMSSSTTSPNIIKYGQKSRLEYKWYRTMRSLRRHQIPHVNSPLQYCFIFNSQHPFQRAYNQIEHDTFKVPHGVDYSNLGSKLGPGEDIELVQDMIRYTNEELASVKKQPVVVKIDKFENNHYYTQRNGETVKRINLSVVECVSIKPKQRVRKVPQKYDPKELSIIRPKAFMKSMDVLSDSPPRDQLFNFLKEFELSQDPFSVRMRRALVQEFSRNEKLERRKELYYILKGCIASFRNTFESQEPILIVFPPFHDLLSPARKVNYKKKKERVVTYGGVTNINEVKSTDESNPEDPIVDEPSSRLKNFFVPASDASDASVSDKINSKSTDDLTYNLLFPSSELAGTDFCNLKNIIILDTVLDPTLATTACYNTTVTDLCRAIPGIPSSYSDLFYYYISKLQMEKDTQERNVLIVQDSFGKNKDGITIRALVNDLTALVNYKSDKRIKKDT